MQRRKDLAHNEERRNKRSRSNFQAPQQVRPGNRYFRTPMHHPNGIWQSRISSGDDHGTVMRGPSSKSKMERFRRTAAARDGQLRFYRSLGRSSEREADRSKCDNPDV